jgi:hypothetical protein
MAVDSMQAFKDIRSVADYLPEEARRLLGNHSVAAIHSAFKAPTCCKCPAFAESIYIGDYSNGADLGQGETRIARYCKACWNKFSAPAYVPIWMLEDFIDLPRKELLRASPLRLIQGIESMDVTAVLRFQKMFRRWPIRFIDSFNGG